MDQPKAGYAPHYGATDYGHPGTTGMEPAPPYSSGYAPTPPYSSGYAPAPPIISQNSSNTNVVVLGQPTTTTHYMARVAPRANDYQAFTIVMFVLCLVHCNLIFLLLLIPAMICSFSAKDYNNAGDYDNAKQCGNMALGCNVCVLVMYTFLVIAAVVIGVLFAVGVLTLTTCRTECDYWNDNCHVVCNY